MAMLPSATDRAHILVTNDDGVQALGLYALVEALREVGEVTVLAPEHNWSASGHSKTMHKPLRVRTTHLADGSEALTSSGSPTDCVVLALLGLLPRRPDIVVSGINQGANVGHDLTYSGTVAAAMESVINGVSAVAASLDSYQSQEFGVAAKFVARLVERALLADVAQPMLLNVNVPAIREEEIKGVQVTRLGKRLYRDALIERSDPRGEPYYWIGGEPPAGVLEEGTDIGALATGYVSVTPVQLDLTDHVSIPDLRRWGLSLG